MKVLPLNNIALIKFSPTFGKKDRTPSVDTFLRSEKRGQNAATIYKKVFNPELKKIEKIPVKIAIVKKQLQPNFTEYQFWDKDTLVGYTQIQDWSKNKNPKNHPDLYDHPELLLDNKEIGIIGKRITIDMLENLKPNLYGGIGEISDQIAVEYCINNDLPLNIICVADFNAHLMHYKRGRRFLKLEPQSPKGEKFYAQYETYNPNEAIEEIIAATPSKTRKFKMMPLVNYMPPNVVEQYLEKIKSSPILAI